MLVHLPGIVIVAQPIKTTVAKRSTAGLSSLIPLQIITGIFVLLDAFDVLVVTSLINALQALYLRLQIRHLEKRECPHHHQPMTAYDS